MSLTAPPPVADPVRRDIDDAVIKEAKRRARRRRLFYGGVLAVVLATVAAFVTWGSAPPPQSPPPGSGAGAGGAGALAAGGAGQHAGDPTLLRKGFIGLPPEGAVPSSPATGVLVLEFETQPVRVRVYADGRVITLRLGRRANIPEAANSEVSGFLEQRLTADGVELLRSYVVNNASALRATPYVTSGPPYDYDSLRVLMEGQLVHASVPGCTWSGGCPRITDPETWLPASAWVDQHYRAYVPTEFEICYGGWVVPTTCSQAPVEVVRAALPQEVSVLLTPVKPWDGSFDSECAIVSTVDARAIDRSLRAAEFEYADDTAQSMIRYVFGVAHPGPVADIQAQLLFAPVLPNGIGGHWGA